MSPYIYLCHHEICYLRSHNVHTYVHPFVQYTYVCTYVHTYSIRTYACPYVQYTYVCWCMQTFFGQFSSVLELQPYTYVRVYVCMYV